MNPPDGMTIVSKEEFFIRLKDDPRDIMPSDSNEDFTIWKSKNDDWFGWSAPGWKNAGAFKTIYAVKK